MNKKTAIIILVIIACILIIAFLFVRNNQPVNPSENGDINVTNLTDSERVVEENKTIELDKPDFMERSGFELVKSENLREIKYDKVYSQEVGKAQINMDYNDKKFSLFISKTKLFENTSDEEPIVYFIANKDVTYVLGDDNIKNYYYEKNGMYYSISTLDNLSNSEIETIIEGFDTKIGENY
jgi:hypothetical protein